MDYENLNPRQKDAVLTTEGPLLIFAGAGSGKTRVLVQRMAHLIHDKGVSPWQVFAVTFTNKAAGEMKERVQSLIDDRADDLWISTFHSTGVRILRRHIEKLNYGRSFVIYDSDDQMTLIKRCLEELEINPKIFHPRAIQNKIDAAKNELIDAEDYPTGDFYSDRVSEVYKLYSQRLRDNNALDFGDLLVLPVKLFENFPEVLNEYTHRFHYLMVDEYQDTNHAQYRLIKLLAQPRQNICVVGDDDQSIYRWRGADIRNILEFHHDFPKAQVIKLEQNYRSTKNILKAAGEVVKTIKGRAEKTLWTDNEEGEPIVVFTGRTEKDEANFVVEQIKKFRTDGKELKDLAIFYRTNAQSRVFEDELRRNNMPYVIFGGIRFYDRMEIRDMLAYLWVLANPADSLHLRRIINVPGRGIGKVSVEKLEKLATQKGISLREVLSHATDAGIADKTAKKVKAFANLLETLQSELEKQKLSEFVQELMGRTGYLGNLKKEGTIEAQSRMENLEELVNVVEEYELRTEQPSLADFLDQVALVSSIDNLEEEGGALPLMTLHLAKGLEFDVVFFVGMEEGLLPHSRSLDTQEEVDEERRLAYVGMTRAKQKLFMANAERRRVFGNDQYNLPSRFLDDLPEDILERIEPPRLSFEDDESRPSFASPLAESSFFQTTSSIEEPNNPYKVGTKVRHPVFGLGTIKGCEGKVENRKITVVFQQAGLKKLVAKISNLTILG